MTRAVRIFIAAAILCAPALDASAQTAMPQVTGSGGVNATVVQCATGNIVAQSAPRLDCAPRGALPSALLVEPASTNYFLTSQSHFSAGAGWGNLLDITIVDNDVTGLDGTTSGSTVSDGTANGQHRFTSSNISFVAGLSYAASLFIQTGTNPYLQLYLPSGEFGTAYADFNASACTVGSSSGVTATATQYANGWCRVSVEDVASSTANGPFYVYEINSPSAAAAETYTGANATINIWGAQMEQAAAPSSYIETTGSAVTRTADADQFTVPSGVGHLRYVFADGSQNVVAVSPGVYAIPTNLDNSRIAQIEGY